MPGAAIKNTCLIVCRLLSLQFRLFTASVFCGNLCTSWFVSEVQIFQSAFCRWYILCSAAAGVPGSTTHPSFSTIPSHSPNATESLSPSMGDLSRGSPAELPPLISWCMVHQAGQMAGRRAVLAAGGSCSIWWLRYQCHDSVRVCCGCSHSRMRW